MKRSCWNEIKQCGGDSAGNQGSRSNQNGNVNANNGDGAAFASASIFSVRPQTYDRYREAPPQQIPAYPRDAKGLRNFALPQPEDSAAASSSATGFFLSGNGNDEKQAPLASMPQPTPKPPATGGSRGFGRHHDVSPEDVIDEDLKNLSLNEREEVYEEIHGVKERRNETPDFINECLQQLEKELKRHSNMNAPYSRALFLNKKYVKSLELMFLRSVEYDVPKTAQKLLLHFEKKMEWFGHEKLTRDIRYSDLDDDARESLRIGVSALFPNVVDTIGRPIHFVPYNVDLSDPLAKCHTYAGWYKLMAIIQRDEDYQKKGVVVVFYSHGATMQHILDGFKFHQFNSWLADATPLRVSALHMCLPNEFLRPLFGAALHFSSPEVRQRMKMHYGSIIECQYELNSYGIPTQIMPMEGEGGTMRYDFIASCLAEMEQHDARKDQIDLIARRGDSGNEVLINEIREVDVLVGKGPQFQWFPGNIALMNIVKELKPRHMASDRLGKKQVAAEALQRVRQSGGRFLERYKDTGWWIATKEQQNHEKCAMLFRNLTKRAREAQRKQEQQQQQQEQQQIAQPPNLNNP
eukprot:CAMPEP_0119557070 /NCGR_PEP_ID=MMETSP1352-20130426/8844_1 /TAXON_ID=265584 /ORGANISM="Stauroneis constricta, Strain CCMP1120" /LENGTH=578 /DNA_ID=CAMNT_0007604111 /DNA_START=81 /DNA_END=1817 /DNA_ORIENTATION=+